MAARSPRVERRQDRHGDDLEAAALFGCALDGAPEHRGPAGGVHREHASPERRGARDRALDRLGDVVELQVEKHLAAGLFAHRDGGRTRLDEELEADLQHPDGVSHGERGHPSALHAREVEREDDARTGLGESLRFRF